MRRSIQNMFSLSFSFSMNFYFAFFLFFCVDFENSIKNDQKDRNFPILRYERIICDCKEKKLLRHYAKELFAPDERFIYTTMRKNYLRSQHSLDIF